MKKFTQKIIFLIFILGLITPLFVYAAPLKYGAWIPYWKKTNGTADALKNLNKLGEIYPFSYEVQDGETLVDRMKITQDPWLNLFAEARGKKIKIIPSILWNNGDAIQAVLASTTLRYVHEDAIVKIVRDNNFDGIDIDYENKNAETKNYFSKFLKELHLEMKTAKKSLHCTIEPRLPLNSRFSKIPKDIIYANDYAAINSSCDQITIIAYDQGNIDIKLNKTKGGSRPYIPIADPDWVKKVIGETIKTIKPSKIMLGVATYGYEYELDKEGNNYIYHKTRSLSYKEFIDLAQNSGSTVIRNLAGELSFAYATSTTINANTVYSTRLVWFSDAQAMVDKIKIAKNYKLRGVSIFKIDGESDPNMWGKLK